MSITGARSKTHNGISYSAIRNIEMNVEPFTIPTMTKWITWMYLVGIFREGMDFLRNGLILVQDLDGYGWKHFDLEFQKKLGSIWQDTFPMRVKGFYILNPPTIFDAVMKIVKTFNKSKMMDRVQIVTKKDISKFIGKDNLLQDFGGEVSYDYNVQYKVVSEWASQNEDRLMAPGREEK